MRALLRKELRQVVPAHALGALVFTLFVLWAFEPDQVLLPSRWEMDPLFLMWALIAIVEGLLVGFLQHGRERKAGTEPYLVHRATGTLRPFLAKVVAGIVALALVVALPPLVYGLWFVVLASAVDNPLTERLGHFVVAGSCCLPAYGIGVLCAQLRKAWGARALFAVLGGGTLLFVTAVASQPPADAQRTPVWPFVTTEALLALAVLIVAYRLFRAGDDETRPWPGRLGVAAALAALAMFWLPWTFGVATLQQIARAQVFEAYPQIVEDEQEGLYLVRELAPEPQADGRPAAWVREFEFRDARGDRVEDERTRKYGGFGFDHDPFLTLFDPSSTPMGWDHPWNDLDGGRNRRGPFAFEGAWTPLDPLNRPSAGQLEHADGTVHWTGVAEIDGSWRPADQVFRRPDTGEGFSPRTVVTYPFSFVLGAYHGRQVLLADLSDRTLWTFVAYDAEGKLIPPTLQELHLPANDELVGLERMQSLFRLRVGLYEPFGVSDALLLVGRDGRYLWTKDGFQPFLGREQFEDPRLRNLIPETDAAEVVRWRLEPSHVDGLGFHLDVVDVESGKVALAHDYRPEAGSQRSWAAVAWLASLARPPAGSLWSYLGAAYEPRDVSRMTTHDAFRDPLLLGGANPLLLGASVVLGLLLAWSAHRRLGRDPRERAVRWTWTLAVFALGLPAWFLCRVLEPSRRGLRASTDPLPAPVAPRILTERDAPRREPVPAP